jgi:hypothetical protein
VLVISEVIKGESTNAEIPIVIGGGLYVRELGPEGAAESGDLKKDELGAATNDSSKHVQIIQRYEGGSTSVVDDAGKDKLWFLRSLGGNFGVEDIRYVQPLKLKEYFESYLSTNPAEAMRSYAAKHPEDAARAQRALDRLQTLPKDK